MSGMELVPVRVRDCACPGTPHEEGDVVLLTPTLGLIAGLEAQRENTRAINDAVVEVLGRSPTDADIEAMQSDENALAERVSVVMNEMLQIRWVPVFIRGGAVGWNFLDDDGLIPFDVDVLLADYSLGRPVADAASELYQDALMRPLVERLAKLSPPSSTDDTPRETRPKRSSTQRRRSSSLPPVSAGQPYPIAP